MWGVQQWGPSPFLGVCPGTSQPSWGKMQIDAERQWKGLQMPPDSASVSPGFTRVPTIGHMKSGFSFWDLHLL